MKTMVLFKRLWRQWLALSLLVMMTACATGPKVVAHGFTFNGLNDKWAESIDLLAYAYGDGYNKLSDDLDKPRTPLFAAKPSLPKGESIYGPMPVGDYLYVKWRLKASGEVLEQKVDLRERLPQDMNGHELTFVLEGRQLYVFVVTPLCKKSVHESPVLKTWRSDYAHAYEIYPYPAEALRKNIMGTSDVRRLNDDERARLPQARAAMEDGEDTP